MNIFKKSKTATKVSLMLFIILMTSILAFAGNASASTFYVDDDIVGNTSIQEAINEADDYDTIVVLDGIYKENIEVNKSVTLFTDEDALIKSNSSEVPVITVVANDVIIDGFSVDANNTSTSGLFILECNNVTIQNNDVFNASIEDFPSKYDMRANYSLVVSFNCSNVTIDNNIIADGFAGVGYVSGENIHITNNDISNVNRGIKFCLYGYDTGNYLYIIGNEISDVGDKGIEVMSHNSVVSGNTIDNICLDNVPFPDNYYASGIFGIRVDNGDYGITNCSIFDNSIINLSVDSSNRLIGIYIDEAEDIAINNNTISDLNAVDLEKQFGILSYYSTNITISNNTVSELTADDVLKQFGIFSPSSENVTIDNNVVSNIYAEYVESQSGIKIKETPYLNASGNKVMNLDIADDYFYKQIGISLCYSDYSHLSDNTIEGINSTGDGTKAGIYLSECYGLNVIDNIMKNSNSTGLIIEDTDDSTFSGNMISNCAQGGLLIDYSYSNLIYNNYFNNEINLVEEEVEFEPQDLGVEPMFIEEPMSPNEWNITKTAGKNIVGGSFLGGNYWAKPDGTGFSQTHVDADGDGICDEQYNLTETEIDFLPLASASAPAPVEKKSSSSGSRAYVGPSRPPEDVNSTDSSIKRVTGDSHVEYDFGDSDGPVLGISFDSKEDKGLVVGNVQVLENVPEDVGESPVGIPYEIMSITLGPEGTISEETADNIIINFKVSLEWINENNIDLSTIRLMRFHDGEWQELPTIQLSDDGEFLYFAAQTPGFSVFTIVGDEVSGSVSVESAESEGSTEVTGDPEEVNTESTPGFTMFFSSALLAIAAFVVRRRK